MPPSMMFNRTRRDSLGSISSVTDLSDSDMIVESASTAEMLVDTSDNQGKTENMVSQLNAEFEMCL